MADGEYKLTELSELSGVPERTIRYYVSKDLLPEPGRGSKSRYTDEHLARLRVIGKLQDVPLPLDVIRETLNRLSGPLEESPMPDESVKNSEEEKEAGGDDRERRQAQASSEGDTGGRAEVALGYIKLASLVAPAMVKKIRRPAGSPAPQGERSTWERISVAASGDIEVHVRRPLSRSQNRDLELLLQRAHELFGEEES